VTVKLTEDVVVDRAEVDARQAAAEAERLLRLGDAFHQEHPKVPRDQIQPVREADYWIVVLDGNHYKLVLLSPEKAALARVDPRNHDTLLEPAQSIRLPQAPEPPVPPDLVHVAYGFKKICTEALDRFRQDVATWEDLVSPGTEPLSRLRLQYPGITPIPNGQVFNDGGLAELGHAIARVAELRQSVPALEATDRTLVVEATAAIRAAIIAVAPATRKSIRTAGDPALPQRTQTEVNLDAVQDEAVDVLRRALDELAPTIQQLIATTPTFLESALLVLREGVAARGELFVQRECQRLRQGRETGMVVDVQATAAVTRLFLSLGRPVKVPAVAWSLTEPWEPPTLQ
jgi:hypothetical protein